MRTPFDENVRRLVADNNERIEEQAYTRGLKHGYRTAIEDAALLCLAMDPTNGALRVLASRIRALQSGPSKDG